jgi:hypothetical protein
MSRAGWARRERKREDRTSSAKPPELKTGVNSK